jgi:hypothetical protein
MNGEAAAGAARIETRRFPAHGVSAHAPMCPEGTEGVSMQCTQSSRISATRS